MLDRAWDTEPRNGEVLRGVRESYQELAGAIPEAGGGGKPDPAVPVA